MTSPWASINRNFWGGDPESLRANRSPYYTITLKTSQYLLTVDQQEDAFIVVY